MNKFCFILALIVIYSNLLIGQQEPQYTQYMYNKIGINPAYAGSNDASCLTFIYRDQWIGIEGAPQTQLLNFNMPLANKRIGVGASLWRNTIGITESLNFEAVYAYRIRLARGMLGAGINGSVRLLRNNYKDAVAIQSGDEAIPVGLQSKYVPNFGFGLYFSNEKTFLGASIPRLLQNNIDFAEENLVITKEIRHMYFMGGFVQSISENVKIQPQILLKIVENAPLDADINVNLIMLDRYSVGLNYRIGGSKATGLGESVDILLGAQVNEKFLIGFGYDITLSELAEYNNGSVEAMIRYCFGSSQGNEYLNPRFF